MHELVIRGGLVVDGTGAPARRADVAVDGGRITAVGTVADGARRTVEADGCWVLPGWVDIHTHYDGQATWDPELSPSGLHGATTVVFGNCSVGFAPVRPGTEEYLISLMEGVEDIPGTVLAEGIDFRWETFPEYLDVLASTGRVADVAAQVPHAALRCYVMGPRGADHTERPTPEEAAEMGRLVAEALRAGAIGFSTSRTRKHRAADGRPTPGLSATAEELGAVADAMGTVGRGVIQANSDFGTEAELGLLRMMGERSGRPVSMSVLQVDHDPDLWRRTLAGIEAADAAGVPMRAQVGSRPIGVLFGLDTTLNPLMSHPGWDELAGLDPALRAERLRDAEVRRALVAGGPRGPFGDWLTRALERTFELGDPPDYEPDPDTSVAARARAAGRDPFELALELMCAGEGTALLYHPFENYTHGDLEVVREMLQHPLAVSGLGDGGAHVGTICDASFTTFLLTHWVRDRTRGPRLPLELVVRRQTWDAARCVGLTDRGVIAPGFRADINVVDPEALRLEPPRVVRDLPAGGRRLVQGVTGYRHTFVAGTETFVDGRPTGATPGRLIRAGRDAAVRA